MALELETKIMQEVGLGMHFNWFNGSGSCKYVREEAARNLAKAIEKHHKAGEKIVAPDNGLLALMDQATKWDENQYILTIAWQVASYVIAAHMEAFFYSEEERPAFLQKREQEIRACYPEQSSRSSRRASFAWFLEEEYE